MRGDEYKGPNTLTSIELEEKYNNFKVQAEAMINKKVVNYYNKKDINNVLNIFIVIGLSIIYVIAFIFAIKSLLSLNLFTFSVLTMLLTSWLIPGIKSRYEQAKNFLKRKLKKKKNH